MDKNQSNNWPEPYIYVSYTDSDVRAVRREVATFRSAGFSVWYREDDNSGTGMPEHREEACDGCALFVLLLTPDALKDKTVLNEIKYAIKVNKPFIAIHLKKTQLPSDLELTIGTLQAILKYNMSAEEYCQKFFTAFERNGLKGNAFEHQHNRIAKPTMRKVIAAAVIFLVLAGAAFSVVCFIMRGSDHGAEVDNQSDETVTPESEQNAFDEQATEDLSYLDDEYWSDILAAEPTSDSFFEIDEDGVLNKYTGEAGLVVIPDGVTEVAPYAFFDLEKNIATPADIVVIPDSVKKIGRNAFSGSLVTQVYMGDGVEMIEESAFNPTEKLQKLRFSQNLKEIHENAFQECGVSHIRLPEGLTMIGKGAFDECPDLKELVMPDSVVTYESALSDCPSLEEVRMSDQITEISLDFYKCPKLNKVHLPENLESLESAFEDCKSLEEIEIPASVTRIAGRSFMGSGLKKLLVHKDSYAVDYAEKERIPYEIID